MTEITKKLSVEVRGLIISRIKNFLNNGGQSYDLKSLDRLSNIDLCVLNASFSDKGASRENH